MTLYLRHRLALTSVILFLAMPAWADEAQDHAQLVDNPLAGATEGERYHVQVPDTLDLADRMEMAINALTNV